MQTEVRLPQWGMGMEDGTVVEWFKVEGDAVREGEPLVEIEAAKVTDVVVAPAGGVLTRIVARVDETVRVGAVLAVIDGT